MPFSSIVGCWQAEVDSSAAPHFDGQSVTVTGSIGDLILYEQGVILLGLLLTWSTGQRFIWHSDRIGWPDIYKYIGWQGTKGVLVAPIFQDSKLELGLPLELHLNRLLVGGAAPTCAPLVMGSIGTTKLNLSMTAEQSSC
jgi:hypothetical protein